MTVHALRWLLQARDPSRRQGTLNHRFHVQPQLIPRLTSYESSVAKQPVEITAKDLCGQVHREWRRSHLADDR